MIQKLQIIRQIALGLAAAHDNAIVHCDLKASNILIEIDHRPDRKLTNQQNYHPHGQMSEEMSVRVKLIDFGIAQLSANAQDEKLNKDIATESNTASISSTSGSIPSGSNNAYGSWTSMSPEQLAPDTDEATIDFRTDLFSLGIIAFNLIAGRHPFASGAGYSADSAKLIAQAIIDHQVCDAKEIIPQLPLPLANLLNQ